MYKPKLFIVGVSEFVLFEGVLISKPLVAHVTFVAGVAAIHVHLKHTFRALCHDINKFYKYYLAFDSYYG